MAIWAGVWGGIFSGAGIILFIMAKEQKEKNALLAGEDGVGAWLVAHEHKQISHAAGNTDKTAV